MKEIRELNLPEDIKYSKNHEWAKQDGDSVVVGITDFAQDRLGDIVFVEMPAPGDCFEAGEECGTLESVKAVSELYLPIAGEIVAVNDDLEETPELVNKDPYRAWIVKVKPAAVSAFDGLLDRAAYLQVLEAE